jgi:hypothetical protein
MKIRLVAEGPRIVPWLNHRAVQRDEVIAIPDEWGDAFLCQTETWRLVEESKTSNAAAKRRGTKDGE